jgi:hypothetical protein
MRWLAVGPGCVGSVVRGSIVKILDNGGRRAPVGTSGRIFVGNGRVFEGYTGGGTKESIGGPLSSSPPSIQLRQSDREPATSGSPTTLFFGTSSG